MRRTEIARRAASSVEASIAKHEIAELGTELEAYFLREMIAECQRRLLPFDSAAHERIQQRLLGWIIERGGSTTVREVQRDFRPRPKTHGEAEFMLLQLVRSGHGVMRIVPTGGRPVDRFTLTNQT